MGDEDEEVGKGFFMKGFIRYIMEFGFCFNKVVRGFVF